MSLIKKSAQLIIVMKENLGAHYAHIFWHFCIIQKLIRTPRRLLRNDEDNKSKAALLVNINADNVLAAVLFDK